MILYNIKEYKDVICNILYSLWLNNTFETVVYFFIILKFQIIIFLTFLRFRLLRFGNVYQLKFGRLRFCRRGEQ